MERQSVRIGNRVLVVSKSKEQAVTDFKLQGIIVCDPASMSEQEIDEVMELLKPTANYTDKEQRYHLEVLPRFKQSVILNKK